MKEPELQHVSDIWIGATMFGVAAFISFVVAVISWIIGDDPGKATVLFLLFLLIAVIFGKLALNADEATIRKAQEKKKPRFDMPRIHELSDEELVRLVDMSQKALQARVQKMSAKTDDLSAEASRLTAKAAAADEVRRLLSNGDR